MLVALLAEGARAGAAERELAGLDFDSLPEARQRLLALGIVRRETGIMTVSTLVVLFLALRAAGTSGELSSPPTLTAGPGASRSVHPRSG